VIWFNQALRILLLLLLLMLCADAIDGSAGCARVCWLPRPD
jgi:hypothetical protein